MNIEEIVQRIENAKTSPFFVFISGGSCVGKTYLTRKLLARFGDEATVLEMDCYFKDRDDTTLPMFGSRTSFDLPESFYLKELRNDLKRLIEVGRINVPIYDISRNFQLGKRIMHRNKIIIVEGLYASIVSDAIESPNQKVNILITASTQTRLQRRIDRDTSRFDWSEKAIETYFFDQIEPIYKMYFSKQSAEVMIENN